MENRLKQLRKELGLKQREIAERLEVATGLWGNWESGSREMPKHRVIQLCKEFNVNRAWLETGEGEMFEPNKSPAQIERETLASVALQIYDALPSELQETVSDVARVITERSAEEEGK